MDLFGKGSSILKPLRCSFQRWEWPCLSDLLWWSNPQNSYATK